MEIRFWKMSSVTLTFEPVTFETSSVYDLTAKNIFLWFG